MSQQFYQLTFQAQPTGQYKQMAVEEAEARNSKLLVYKWVEVKSNYEMVEEITDKFLGEIDKALAGLKVFSQHLYDYRQAVLCDHIIPDEFMEHIRELDEAGLLEWADGLDLDQLREAVTGQEM